ncbi:MAG: helix-turn-helix domain-containing protein [Clostridiales bacterium]|jgi:predicted transcriptional regulator|nr:helix-turn-helix domain-containing protein [Clostridiales bacterium]
MLYYQSLQEGFPLFKALGSQTRIDILELLIRSGPMRMTNIAAEMDITGGALTSHIKALNDAGIIAIEERSGKHGIQKICHIVDDRILIDYPAAADRGLSHRLTVALGDYARCEATAPCGLATAEHALEPQNDPAVFDHEFRSQAGLLWLAEGTLEYCLPNPLKTEDDPTELQLILELAAGTPSAPAMTAGSVLLSINDKEIGNVELPLLKGKLGNNTKAVNWRKGSGLQRGASKIVRIDKGASYQDGHVLSGVKLSDLKLAGDEEIRIKLQVSADGPGMLMFGQEYGQREEGLSLMLRYNTKKRRNTKKT